MPVTDYLLPLKKSGWCGAVSDKKISMDTESTEQKKLLNHAVTQICQYATPTKNTNVRILTLPISVCMYETRVYHTINYYMPEYLDFSLSRKDRL